MSSVRLTASWVLGYEDGDHLLIPDGEVAVDGGRISYVGSRRDRPGDVAPEDLGQAIIMPGLIDLDAIADIDHAILDSWSSSELGLGRKWSQDYAQNRRRHVFTDDERRLIRRFAFAQLVLHGVTTCMPIAGEMHSEWAESFDDAVAMAEEAARLGIRAWLGPSYRSGVNVVDAAGRETIHWEPRLGEEGLADAVRFVRWAEQNGGETVTGVLLPCRIETLTTELIAETVDARADLGVKLRMHALQGLVERDRIAERFAASPLLVMDEFGVLGPDLLLPHATHIDGTPRALERDLRNGARSLRSLDAATGLLADHGVSVVHCPLTSARYGTALDSFARFRRAGVRLCLGTDSFPPDLLRGIDVGSNVAKILDGRLDAAPVEDYVRAATLGGAEALGRDDLGRLAAGAQADVVAFALDDFRDGIVDDPIRTLIANGTARTATYSMIAGRAIMRDGELVGVDLAELRAEAQGLFERMRRAYSERDWRSRPVDELFPATFRVREDAA